jgi:hypothetical protein
LACKPAISRLLLHERIIGTFPRCLLAFKMF